MTAVDRPMPQDIRDWMNDRNWGQHHLRWHVNRLWFRFSASERRDLERQGFSEASRLEGSPGNGLDFLAMHRIMMQMLIEEFPQHSDLFKGWSTPPTDPNDPKDYVPRGEGAAGPEFPERFKTAVANIENRPELFDNDDAFGLYVQTPRNSTLPGAGIHNWLHNRWSDITVQLNLANPSVNMENQRFWKLHGWIDAQWTKFREAKGFSDDQPEYAQALQEAKNMMGGHDHHGDHHMMVEPSFESAAVLKNISSPATGPMFKSPSFHRAALAPSAPDTHEPLPTRFEIHYDSIEIVSGIVPDTWFVVVSGYKPYANARIDFHPAIYIRQPEWWRIELVGTIEGIGLPVISSFTLAIPLDGITGTQGVEIVNGDQSVRLSVPPKDEN